MIYLSALAKAKKRASYDYALKLNAIKDIASEQLELR